MRRENAGKETRVPDKLFRPAPTAALPLLALPLLALRPADDAAPCWRCALLALRPAARAPAGCSWRHVAGAPAAGAALAEAPSSDGAPPQVLPLLHPADAALLAEEVP